MKQLSREKDQDVVIGWYRLVSAADAPSAETSSVSLSTLLVVCGLPSLLLSCSTLVWHGFFVRDCCLVYLFRKGRSLGFCIRWYMLFLSPSIFHVPNLRT